MLSGLASAQMAAGLRVWAWCPPSCRRPVPPATAASRAGPCPLLVPSWCQARGPGQVRDAGRGVSLAPVPCPASRTVVQCTGSGEPGTLTFPGATAHPRPTPRRGQSAGFSCFLLCLPRSSKTSGAETSEKVLPRPLSMVSLLPGPSRAELRVTDELLLHRQEGTRWGRGGFCLALPPCDSRTANPNPSRGPRLRVRSSLHSKAKRSKPCVTRPRPDPTLTLRPGGRGGRRAVSLPRVSLKIRVSLES